MDRYRIAPDSDVDLALHDPRDRSAFDGGKTDGRRETAGLNARLEQLQETFYADGRQRLLVVLQGMDASGKDGTIRHVFDGVNPQGVAVVSFKAPSAEELAHDYLWRIHRRTPRRGQIVIFNRSHYEDVLVVRVKNLVDEATWSRRYDQINEFERMLVDEGTTIRKFFLNISPEEQKQRFQARLDEPDKRWKFRMGDLEDRKLWPEYRRAYETVLSRTSTPWAPWYAVPADRKWYRNLVVSRILVQTLESLDLRYPPPEPGLEQVVID